MANTYDFYKPALDSEYPEVDGPLTLVTYITSLDNAYTRYREKYSRRRGKSVNGRLNGVVSQETDLSAFSLEDVDYPVFHSPYGKLVQKAHGRLVRYFHSYRKLAPILITAYPALQRFPCQPIGPQIR